MIFIFSTAFCSYSLSEKQKQYQIWKDCFFTVTAIKFITISLQVILPSKSLPSIVLVGALTY